MALRYNFYFIFVCGLVIISSGMLEARKARKKSSASVTESVSPDAPKESFAEIEEEATIIHDDVASDTINEQKKERRYSARILLDQHALSAKGAWKFESEQGFTVSETLAMPVRGIGFDTNTLSIGHASGLLYINGRRCKKKEIYLIPHDGTIKHSDYAYHGAMMIVAYEDSWLLVNVIDLEDYIYSVLQSESWPGWPLEVNKVFAITSRTYAIAMILRAKAQKLPYHLRNTNIHQTYQGVHTNIDLRQAVEKTRGLFVGYDNKPILAMFDSCCGGIIPAHIRDFDFKKAPYLAREYPCTHCKRCKIFNWEVAYDLDELAGIIKQTYPHLATIKKVEILKRDKAGLVDKIAITGRKHKEIITGKKLYSLLKDVKSFSFNIHMRGEMVHIKGTGYGHHLGLCQWGAREMVRDGSDYRSILRFYYPGTCFMTLI